MNPAEDYNLKQSEPYRSILLRLQVIVVHAISIAELKYKWGFPFYYVNGKPFCYFNTNHKRQFVDIAFVKGNQITVFKSHHVTEKRKKMMSLRYQSLDDVNDAVVIAILREAYSLY